MLCACMLLYTALVQLASERNQYVAAVCVLVAAHPPLSNSGQVTVLSTRHKCLAVPPDTVTCSHAASTGGGLHVGAGLLDVKSV